MSGATSTNDVGLTCSVSNGQALWKEEEDDDMTGRSKYGILAVNVFFLIPTESVLCLSLALQFES